MRRKTVIVGMNNPLSDDPAHALYPAPVNCAGWRLWQLLHDRTGATRTEYLRGFTRLNLVECRPWCLKVARHRAEEMMEWLEGRRVILLGTAVRTAFRLPPVLVRAVESRGVVFRQLPHPSGRCRWYNDPKHRAIAGMLLEQELSR